MNNIFNNPQNKYKKAFYSTISYSFFVISRPMARQHRNNVPYICIIYLEIESLKWLPKTAQIRLKRHQAQWNVCAKGNSLHLVDPDKYPDGHSVNKT